MNFELKKTKEIVLKLKLALEKVKSFNLTKYLLIRREDAILAEILSKKDFIELQKKKIDVMKRVIIESEELIIEAQKAIKKLETDRKKVIKVINLYID